MASINNKKLNLCRHIKTISVIVFIIFFAFSAPRAEAQYKGNKFSKRERSYHKAKYGRQVSTKPGKKCKEIARKKKRGPRQERHIVKRTPSKKRQAEADYTPVATITPKPAPKPQPKPTPKPKPQPEKEPVAQTIEEKHKITDDVLTRNDIPPPTSQKHEEIRQVVEQQLKTIETDKPIKLEPLFFNFDEDEFSVVDMDPFLVAVEYALQGRIILIEGHTDNRGKDDYNVNLSMKRVEKIRQLMLDMGVADEKISVVGYGEEHSKDEATTEEDNFKHRRVDFTVF